MKGWKRTVSLTLVWLLTACDGQLAAREERYLAQGYTRLSAYAYVRETDDGHGFSHISEGELGEAVVLTYLRRRAEQASERLRQARAGGVDAAELERLEGRVKAAEWRLDSFLNSFGERPGWR